MWVEAIAMNALQDTRPEPDQVNGDFVNANDQITNRGEKCEFVEDMSQQPN